MLLAFLQAVQIWQTVTVERGVTMLEHWPKLRMGAFLSPGDIFGQIWYIDLMQKLCSLLFD